MKQKIFKTKILEKLENDVLINKDYYIHMKENPYWLVDMLKKANNNNFTINSQIDVEPFELIIGGPSTDIENAKIIYSNLKNLKPVQAVLGELWTYMTHIQFAKYMSTRWNINDNDIEKNLKAVIEQRYFAIRGRGKGVVRNGIARLWLAGYWGYDENRENPFELVEVILNKQEVYEHISERSYNRNKNVLIASLEAVKLNNFDTRNTRRLYGKINSYGSDKQLDALDYNESKKMVNELVEEIYVSNLI